MPFSEMLNDKVSILKKNGERIADVRASVQSKRIFINGSDILIETGDLVHRKMSNGGEETYEVIDPGFHESFHGIDAGYQITHRKLGHPEATAAVQNITYNISGSNARVNNQSTDNSTNVTLVNSEIEKYLEELRSEIRNTLEDKEKQSALEVVSAVEEQFSNPTPSKAIVSALLAALPNAGSIASIVSLLLASLAP